MLGDSVVTMTQLSNTTIRRAPQGQIAHDEPPSPTGSLFRFITSALRIIREGGVLFGPVAGGTRGRDADALLACGTRATLANGSYSRWVTRHWDPKGPPRLRIGNL